VIKSFSSGTMFGERHGTGAPQVVALHGWARSSADFTRVMAGLDGYALDLPGFGSSPEPPEVWDTRRYAEAVAGALAELTDAPIVILGHSFGARVAVRLAAAHPELVSALVLTGAPLVRLSASRAPLELRVAKKLRALGFVSAARVEKLRDKHGSTDYRNARGVMRGVLVAAVNDVYDEDLRRISCPVHLVCGENDTAASVAVGKAVLALLKDGSLTVLPGVGHLTPIDAPQALHDAVVAAIAGEPA
jgi:pimeloyl-ACP methyl ester carboxylesterase